MSKTLDLLRGTFTTEVVDTLVGAVNHAYEVNYDRYDPSVGHDLMTFGLMLFKSRVHYIKQLAHKHDWIQIVQIGPAFRFRIGEYTLASHRVGDSIDDEIENLFPRNQTAAWKLAERNRAQRKLPFPHEDALDIDDSRCRSLILADVGNPTDGLCKLFLGIPSEISPERRISGWSSTHELWTNEDLLARGSDPIIIGRTPAEKDVPPTLTLKDVSEKSNPETVVPPELDLKNSKEVDDKKKQK
jgi:hypothetical protein